MEKMKFYKRFDTPNPISEIFLRVTKYGWVPSFSVKKATGYKPMPKHIREWVLLIEDRGYYVSYETGAIYLHIGKRGWLRLMPQILAEKSLECYYPPL